MGMALRCMMALRWPRPDSELLCLCIFPVLLRCSMIVVHVLLCCPMIVQLSAADGTHSRSTHSRSRSRASGPHRRILDRTTRSQKMSFPSWRQRTSLDFRGKHHYSGRTGVDARIGALMAKSIEAVEAWWKKA